ncbi:MAG: hypothetical protein KKF67_03820 [Nanoarchaeota archaeon]|nr:hypothetical protein [Nanoarchaeota archaeon]
MTMEITPDLAEICGIHAGDGYLRNREGKIELELGGSKEEKPYYDNHVVLLFNKVFGLKLKGKFYSKGTYGFVTTNNQFKIFDELGFPYGKKSKIVNIPKIILNSKNKLLYVKFLRGLFDTDGHLGFRKSYGNYLPFKIKKHHYPVIHITSISRLLIERVSLMLKQLGITSFTYSSLPKKSNEQTSYRVIISGVGNVERWMKIIGSKNPVKLSRYLIWKKFGFCPTNTTFEQREDILNGKLNIFSLDP